MSVAVEGRFVATTRTALSGDVVAAVAGAPELSVRRDAFAVAADGVTAVIANAVAGFWYAWEVADEPTGPFAPAGSPVRASLDGELVIKSAGRLFIKKLLSQHPSNLRCISLPLLIP